MYLAFLEEEISLNEGWNDVKYNKALIKNYPKIISKVADEG